MQNEHDPISDDQFESFLDGTLPETDQELLRKKTGSDKARSEEAELQQRIDIALRRVFPVAVAPERNPFLLDEDSKEVTRRLAHGRRWILGGAVAAALCGILLSWWVLSPGDSAPYFRPKPLAEIYHETLKNGFRPYYECRDDERFAAIFASRQGIPLHLLTMPEGSRMLGLSYPGGLSRDTTAMLCLVDDEPVMVFVDQAEADSEIADKSNKAKSSVNVFRVERDGLVIYEVSPLSEPRAMQYLAVGRPSVLNQ